MTATESRSRHVQFRDGGRLFAQAGSVGFINKVGATTYRDYAKSKSGEPQKFFCARRRVVARCWPTRMTKIKRQLPHALDF